ncbi:MAG TPA: ribonuclease domain-containing protein [Gallionella sp.]|nr:ribonuclease domain-containing protein [Gallionella sp.]
MLRLMRVVFAAMLWLPLATYGSSQNLQTEPGDPGGLPVVSVANLPAEARETLRAIKQGGPFAFDRDGAVFNNFEQVLPKRQRGYYHEYTVRTPGMNSRGVRRIISGDANEYYYTADHYQTFKRILE